MTMKSTSDRYGAVALTLHWTSAALILSLIPLGFAMQSAPDGLRDLRHRHMRLEGDALERLALQAHEAQGQGFHRS